MTVQAVKKIDVKEIKARDRDRSKGDGGDFALYLAGLVQQNRSTRPAEKSGPEGGAARGVADGTAKGMGVGKSTGKDGSTTVAVDGRYRSAVTGMKAVPLVPLDVFLQGENGEETGAGVKAGVSGELVDLAAGGSGIKAGGKGMASAIILKRAAGGYGEEKGLKVETPGDVLKSKVKNTRTKVELKAAGRQGWPAAIGNDPRGKPQASSMALMVTALHKGEDKAPVAGGDAAAADVVVKGYPAAASPDGLSRVVPPWENKLNEAVSPPTFPEQGFKGDHGDAGKGKDPGGTGLHIPLSASTGLKPEALPAGQEVSLPLLRNLPEITGAVLEAARVARATGRQELEIRLQPENLGHMKLTASIMDGRLVVHFLVENREAARILQAAVPDMRQTLAQQGFHLDQVYVQVGGEGSGGSQAWEQGAREWGPRRPLGRTPVPPGGGEAGISVGSWHRFDYLA
ncbi:flagellar hook-length control protein FliK [Neomoorella humiferrea]|uniref:flagellar hook-length control protein FliK n=1 Tax=Neomoorella humiferrea TaxID=676965 RepID=UPI003D91D634